MGAEQDRLDEADTGTEERPLSPAAGPAGADVSAPWRQWGPFVSEREWGTVREDYSADGEAWRSLTHDEARSTAYRWGEDGLAAICDRRQAICLGLAMWNGRDPILKERLFGLTGKEGNHGEDVKECYWYVDATPTHSWLHWRYHYPQAAFPYEDLIEQNQARGYADREYELLDTGVFDHGYWAVTAEYAKATATDLCLRVRATNHGPATATLHLLPTLWFRNVWSWGSGKGRPVLHGHAHADGHAVVIDHARLGRWVAVATGVGPTDTDAELLFCENESNTERLYATPGSTPYPKDGINDHVVSGATASTVNPARTGTKAAWWFQGEAAPGATLEWRVRFTRIGEEPVPAAVPLLRDLPAFRAGAVVGGETAHPDEEIPEARARDAAHAQDAPLSQTGTPAGVALTPATAREWDELLDHLVVPPEILPDLGAAFATVMNERKAEADEFYADHTPVAASADEATVLRQAWAGLLWSQQFYRYQVARWLDGDPATPPPPAGRGDIRNGHWRHLDANDVIVMPDKWEYPWFASWDLAFHCVSLAHIDPQLAKQQLLLLFRVWYQHPNGALPAYEWEFSDANPPVHAWAAMRVFEIDAAGKGGVRDIAFLQRIFHKLLLNFTWWVNREDAEGNNAFEGGFLGLDNIGPFNRSEHLPIDGVLEQSDGTGWMAMFCLNLLHIALTLAADNKVYEDMAVKFFEHFTLIADAMNETGLWSEEDAFFYDIVRMADGSVTPLKIRSMVGLVPAAAVITLHDADVAGLESFLGRARWFIEHRQTATGFFGRYVADQDRAMGLLSVVSPDRLRRILECVLSEDQFLSPYGLRSLSRFHLEHPVIVDLGPVHAEVRYEPAESASGLFGGNSNWRGPIWMPLNVLMIEKLRHFHDFLGDEFTMEFPTGSGRQATLAAVADDLSDRLVSIFTADPASDPPGRRAVFGDDARLQNDPHWHDLPWFFEYFDGDTGRGLGASHQTCWTALVATLIVDRYPPGATAR